MLYIHTPKAVKHGEPADRLFLVVGVDDATGDQIAWKCTITKEGIVHPGFKKPLSVNQIVRGTGQRMRYPNGSDATAVFKPDSLYRQIDIEILRQLIQGSIHQSLMNVSLLIERFKSAEQKLTKEERAAVHSVFGNIELCAKYANNW